VGKHPSREEMLVLYQVVAARRQNFDLMVWQVPALSLTAQAFRPGTHSQGFGGCGKGGGETLLFWPPGRARGRFRPVHTPGPRWCLSGRRPRELPHLQGYGRRGPEASV
jgi:hypothetical protein